MVQKTAICQSIGIFFYHRVIVLAGCDLAFFRLGTADFWS